MSKIQSKMRCETNSGSGHGGHGMRYFNTEGRYKPEEHYMVCRDDRLR